MTEFLQALAPQVEHFRILSYWIVFLAAFLESLTILGVLFLFVLTLFLGTVEDFLTGAQLVHMDENVAHLIPCFREPYLTTAFEWITSAADVIVVLGFSFLVSILFWCWGKRNLIPGLWVSIVSGGGLNFIAKNLFLRPRPDVAIILEDSYSFPSGHATLVVALYGFLAYALWKKTKTSKSLIVLVTLGIVASVGLSRMYLGVHYFSDVWGGFLLGGLCLLTGIGVTEYLESNRSIVSKKLKSRHLITTIVLVSGLGLYSLVELVGQEPALPVSTPAVETVSTNEVVTPFASQELPSYTETLYGSEERPLSLLFLGNEALLAKTFEGLGWKEAMRKRFISLNLSFWNAHVPDFVFVKDSSILKVWKTSFQTEEGSKIYVATTCTYEGRKWKLIPQKGKDLDQSRDALITELSAKYPTATIQKSSFVEPFIGEGFLTGEIISDGALTTIDLNGALLLPNEE